ncbi:MAG TPA: hypothetical protein VMZ52_06340 [Bryobacteraceae bacterium]|nr:hypothetical protein [Bryobacteraceae bacterium]
MSQTRSNQTPAIGLDIGTSRIVTAERADTGYQYRAQLNAFVSLPYSSLTESVLTKENVPYSVLAGEIVVNGTESERFADLLGVETRRPMAKGVLNPGEPESLTQIQKIVEQLIGPGKGRRLYFSVPAAPAGSEEGVSYHEASLRRILMGAGYTVRSINEGLAVVYSELESSSYTGIGVSCGGGLCNVCLAYMSVPVVSFSLAKGGDFIDASAAAATGDLTNRIKITKEDTFHFNGYFADKKLQALSVYYEDLIQSLIAAMKEAFAASRSLPKLKRPIPLVLSGGSTLPGGFRDRFEAALRASEFPIQIDQVRLADNPLEATARGALIAALSE